MSCIEAAKLILGCEGTVRFLTREDGKKESYGDFDFFLYTKLTDARELVFEILQDRTVDMGRRMAVCLALAHDLQGHIKRDRLYEADALFARYRRADRNAYFERKLKTYEVSPEERCRIMKEMLEVLDHMEVLKPDWTGFVKDARGVLYGSGPAVYRRGRLAFLESGAGGRLALWREQLMVYFVFTYFSGAVYNGNPYGKMKLAAVSTLIIEELAQAVWSQQDGRLDFMDFVDVAHRYSREVEHSDVNKKRLEESAVKNPAFSLDRLLRAL